jgi:putative DNA primase/helicase
LAATAQAITDRLANVPAALRSLPRWVCWKYETRGGKATKVLYNPITHKRASSTDQSTWADYTTAVDASSTHGYAGLGCVIAAPYAAVDLDKCRDATSGEVEPWAAFVIAELGSYTELSPSGRGFHIWISGSIPHGGNRRGRVEMYDSARYFTVTGDHVAETPLTIEARDLTALHARMMANTLEVIPPEPCKVIPFERRDKPSRDDLLAGHWEGHESQSNADFALCVMLAEDFGGDAYKINEVFCTSGLYREKWNEKHGAKTYGERTIDKALEFWRGKGAICTIDDGPEAPAPTIPIYPAEALDGDYIGELTRILTDGTSIPPQFVRENMKCILGAVIDGRAGFPNQPDLHTRHYTINVSLHPRTGKGESWKRTGDSPNGLLNGMLSRGGVRIIDGGLFGSGEYMTKILSAAEHDRSPSHVLARFDEMVEVFEKAKATGSTLESKLLQLYERNAVASGSFKNGEHQVANTHLSLTGDFTRDNFQRTFEGRGSGGSGFLARCTLSFADKVLHAGDWEPTNYVAATNVLTALDCCTDTVTHLPDRLVPKELEEARELRWEFFQHLRNGDARYTPELEAHFKRDLLMRVLFSKDTQIDAARTRQSIAWAMHQLDVRNELWPEDAGGPIERMERCIVKALVRGSLTITRLRDFCNVNRPGSGGHEVFNRALRALTLSRGVEVVGKSQRGTPVYAMG